jgi:hypothetical protein
MKTIHMLILMLILSNSFAQEVTEKVVKTEANEVTVFLESAQIVSKKNIDLSPGTTLLKFSDLSPFIDPKSVQVKAAGELVILSVNHQQNYLKNIEKSKELQDLENSEDAVENKIRMENTFLAIIKEELAFLADNRDIGGKNEQVNVANLQQASDYYFNKLTSLKLNEIERNKTLEDLNVQKRNLQNQIQTLSATKEQPTGEIVVKVETRKNGSYLFELSYLVGNTGWFPTYDIRAKNINEPVQLIYKANVKQDTRMDWNNVKLKFSSSNPNVSGVAPILQTYYLNYNTLPPDYKSTYGTVSGKLMGQGGEPLPGANVMVTGTTIGTVADAVGNFSITIPNNSNQLTFSFIGYETQTLPITGGYMNVVMEEKLASLQEVVVAGYGAQEKLSDVLQGRAAGLDIRRKEVRIRGLSSTPVPVARVEKQTTVDFEINTPYTIKSDNKNYTVDMEVYELPADYQYYCVPKIDKDAFLIARIIDWEKYNLLEGEANIFFEGTYVGKTIMDVRYVTDTLDISLGRDKNVSVNREKVKDFTTRQFIGNKKEETRLWKTSIKNNKQQEIHMVIFDQVPVSNLEEIEVDVQNTSNAELKSETGEIKWEFNLKPQEKKEFELKYTVKYPKYGNLIIE